MQTKIFKCDSCGKEGRSEYSFQLPDWMEIRLEFWPSEAMTRDTIHICGDCRERVGFKDKDIEDVSTFVKFLSRFRRK